MTQKYWTGAEAAIIAAEAAATALVTGLPEYRDGQEVAPEARVTARWAEPRETATPGTFAIPAYPGMDVPEGCAEADGVSLPKVMEDELG
ncbi:hypothetical protein [Ketogulonicigenium vulgare]|uniref:Uncharacterized protein n=1 Tax=Ketogulonicigenium vulgare (strain WSH-001) TaxID=759362 RepID=F9Y9Q7_KETVW|nr:hypothetical protein [Ketogulonicigenium vulgare]ADO43104.1 hypothetical protein EIO_1995 [Ketogulonicigenium vulgare Y25]AEM41395.1 hypothetical protein KVU_1556 [Ketogulonicigenium vulgare WSH-001]ALJ81529.1 hypothetical protein KVH_10295 [Ketogulonicigenium vulgare]ANW35111.1 hypothetical protein KvSKV_10235 [Ketogulonicigenium vulgare]AOZ55139.1 hypothetical protein KVC_2132 [Ketogulonicigenium vulgare]